MRGWIPGNQLRASGGNLLEVRLMRAVMCGNCVHEMAGRCYLGAGVVLEQRRGSRAG